jgi:hypothetical protein
MKSLPPPADSVANVFRQCISNYKLTMQTRLVGYLPLLISSETQYQQAGAAKNWYLLPQHAHLVGSRGDHLRNTYKSKMSKKGQPGRLYYDRIRSSAPLNQCPICAERIVSTVDHYLPKESFPQFVVLPINLLPVCKDCNFDKLNFLPATANEQLFHPYYDNVSQDIWLEASIVYTQKPIAKFSVVAPTTWPAVLTGRVETTFRILELAKYYSKISAQILEEMKYRLEPLFQAKGNTGVRQYLHDEVPSRVAVNPNSWKAALFRTMANDAVYHNGGFR